MSRGLNKPFRIDLTNARTGQGEPFPCKGKFIRVVDASSAAAECQISLSGDFNTTDFRMALMASITERQGFDGFNVKNTAQPNEWVLVVVSDGPEDFDYERPMNNNIGQILTDVKVINGASAFAVVAAGVETILNNILALFQNRKNLRTGLTDLTNANYYRVSGATTTVIASGTNTAGAWIRTLCIDIEGGGGCYVQIGANLLFERLASAQNGGIIFLKDIFVKPGDQIIFSCAGGQSIIAHIEL